MLISLAAFFIIVKKYQTYFYSSSPEMVLYLKILM